MKSIVLLALIPTIAWGALPVRYTSDHASGADPTGQEWTASEAVIGTDSSPVDGLIDLPFNVGPVDGAPQSAVAWQIHDQLWTGATNLPRYSTALSVAEQDLLVANGWEFSATVRLVRNGDDDKGALVGWDVSPTSSAGSGFARRIGFSLSIGVRNDFVIMVTDGSSVIADADR